MRLSDIHQYFCTRKSVYAGVYECMNNNCIAYGKSVEYHSLTPSLLPHTESSTNPEPPKTEKSPSPPAQQPPQEDTSSEAVPEKKEDTVNQSKESEPPQNTGDQ